MPQALDAAYPRWTPALLKQLGVKAVGRYLSWLPNPKVITKAEYDGYLADAIAVFLIWESTGQDYVGGYAVGFRAGVEARRQARVLGHPDERPIFWTIDTGAVFTQSAVDYARGFNDGGGCGPQGFYGDVEIGDHLLGAGLVRVFWQTNARAWPGDATDSPRAALIQRTSKSYPQLPATSYDESDIFVADFGQHPRPAAQPAPKPSPPPKLTTTDLGDVPVKRNNYSPVKLDDKGNGNVPAPHGTVQSIVPHGGREPNEAKVYDKVPVCGVSSDGKTINIEQGVPFGVYSVDVWTV